MLCRFFAFIRFLCFLWGSNYAQSRSFNVSEKPFNVVHGAGFQIGSMLKFRMQQCYRVNTLKLMLLCGISFLPACDMQATVSRFLLPYKVAYPSGE